MIDKKAWNEFRTSGMLWFVNTILHAFGWAIVLDIDDNGEVVGCSPARVKFRGFSEEVNTKGYIALSEYLKQNIDDIEKEAKQYKNSAFITRFKMRFKPRCNLAIQFDLCGRSVANNAIVVSERVNLKENDYESIDSKRFEWRT